MRRPDGTAVLHQIVPTEEQVIAMPEHMAGPFLFQFGIADNDGMHNFEGRVLVNDEGFVMAFSKFPVLAAVSQELHPTAIIEKITESESDYSPIKVLTLDVAATFLKGNHIVISQQRNGGELLAFIADESGKTYTLPFYNFYENGTVCTGTLDLYGEVWQRIQNLLTSRTTPHRTYGERGVEFRPKDGQIIKDAGGKMKNVALDLPEVRPLITRLMTKKPIGKIQP